MRLLQLEDVREGMTIAHPLYGVNGEILIKEQSKLSKGALNKLETLGWNFLYVEDAYSEGIENRSLVAPKTKNTAIVNLKKLYEFIESSSDEEHNIKHNEKELQALYDACVKSVDDLIDDLVTDKVTLVDIYDVKMIANYQYGHSVNVLIIAVVIGKALGYNQIQLKELGLAAYFHDVGIAFLPKELVDMPGKYTDEDILTMRLHAEYGYRFVKDHFHIPLRSYVSILQHHERYDGTGYPLGKKGSDINPYARILAVADVYDAMTTDKPYRKALSPMTAFKHVIQNNKTAFDPKIVKLFFEKVSPYPIGFTLHLPDGRDGIVVENIEGQPLYPKVKIIKYKGIDIEVPYVTTLEPEK